jgi:hypothetical protein
MNLGRLRQYEMVMRQEQAEALVQAVRAAPPHRQADALTRRMQALDVAARRGVYPLLTDTELDLLVPGMSTYLGGLSAVELRAIDRDERTARQALRAIQRQQRGDHHAEA